MATAKQKLIIVESPAKAKTISKFLGKGYKVEASQGHVRDLPKSQLGVDVDKDFEMKYITIRGRGDILAKIKKEAKTASTIYLATDPDREGEAISWHLAQVLDVDVNKPCRIEFHEVTKTAIQQAIKTPRVIDMGRVDAQQARRALDRLVGYKISPLLWAKVKKGLSAGRVQSVATRMVVNREQDIEAFIPEEYWEIAAKATSVNAAGKKENFKVKLASLDHEKIALHTQAEAESVTEKILNGEFKVARIKNSSKHKMPAPPFTTSSLQQEASRKLNFTTAKTMQVVQQLYEGIDIGSEGTQGIVTYIRTDSVRISEEAIKALRAYIPVKFGVKYLPDEPNEYRGRKNAQDAHEAIRPTDVTRTPESIKEFLTRDQYQLYRLIYNRCLASQMNSAAYETMTAELESGDIMLRFYGEHKVHPGFTVVYEEGSDEVTESTETALPELHEGDALAISDVESTQHFTQPPSRYTEASLVRTLEEKGIGRPSTYAPTITTIISRGYVSRENKRLYPTQLGKMVTAMMEEYFAEIVDMDFTADLETQLDEVEEGNEEWKDIIRKFYPTFDETLKKAEEQIEKVQVKDEESDVICDKCGARMVYKMGRFGRFLACPNFPECRNTQPIVNYIAAPCPKCGARLLEKTSKKNRIFYGCEAYPECDFVSWDMPVADKCPQCGSYMVQKRGKKGEIRHICSNEKCRYITDVLTPVEDSNE